MIATVPDLLRLLVIPVFGWAAWQDIKTRRISDRLWVPLIVLGGILLIWESAQFIMFGKSGGDLFFIRAGISLVFIPALGYAFWWFGAFGMADVKAMVTLSILLPTFPIFTVGDFTLPIVDTVLGVFPLTVLTNSVLLAMVAPVGLATANLARGRFEPIAMFIARPVTIDSLPRRSGKLFETLDGTTHDGLDLDVLRMYLRWRGITIASLRAAPDEARDPSNIDTTNKPTDGRTDVDNDLDWGTTETASMNSDDASSIDFDDPWGIERFFDDVERSTYGADPNQLRAGLELLAETDSKRVWVMPGVPFIVPFVPGLIVAFTYGDVLFGILGWLGILPG